MAKDVISEQKKDLALQTAADLIMVVDGDVPDRLKRGFVELFEEIPNQLLQRFRGLIAGIVVAEKEGGEPDGSGTDKTA